MKKSEDAFWPNEVGARSCSLLLSRVIGVCRYDCACNARFLLLRSAARLWKAVTWCHNDQFNFSVRKEGTALGRCDELSQARGAASAKFIIYYLIYKGFLNRAEAL